MAVIKIVDNFAGGLNKLSPESLQNNESSRLENILHIEGNLQTIDGRTLYTSATIATAPVTAIVRYYNSTNTVDGTTTTKQAWTVARCSNKVWVDISTDDSGTFRPILKRADAPPGEREGFAQYGGYLYFTSPNGGVYRWDGTFFATGRANCEGGTALIGSGSAWTNVKPGDTVFIQSTSNATSAWKGPYTINRVSSATGVRMTTTGANLGTGINKRYIISRVNKAGLGEPLQKPTVSTASPAALPTGTYKYRYTFFIDGLGESPFGSPTASVAISKAGQHARVTVYYHPDLYHSPIKEMRIYRTAVNGTTYKLNHHALLVNTASYTYDDTTPDAELSGTFQERLYSWYMDDPAQAPVVSTAGSPAIAAGSYKYRATLYNSRTGYESNPSLASATVTISSGQYPVVAINLNNCDRQADKVRFYRTVNAGSLFKYCNEVDWTAGSTSVTYHDSGVADSQLGALVSTNNNRPNPKLTNLLAFNDRLYGWGNDDEPQRLYFSELGAPEYWNSEQYGLDDPAFTQPHLGGYVDMGNAGEAITAVVPEGGVWSVTGRTGANLLVFTKRRAFRWWGMDWTDFERTEAFDEGCVSPVAALNAGGLVAWVNRKGPMVKALNQPLPEKVFIKLFPPISYPFEEQVTAGGGSTDYFEKCCTAYWRDWFMFAWPQTPSTYPNYIGMLHLPTNTFTIVHHSTDTAFNCFSVWNGPGDNGQLLYGDGVTGKIWRLFNNTNGKTYWIPSSTTGIDWIYRTPLFYAAKNEADKYSVKTLKRVVVVVRDPNVSNQTMTVRVYTNGNDNEIRYTKNITPVAVHTGKRRYLSCYPNIAGRCFQVEILGTWVYPLMIEEIGMIFETENEDIDREVG